MTIQDDEENEEIDEVEAVVVIDGVESAGEVDSIDAINDPDLEPAKFDHSLYIAEYLLSCRNTPLDILRIDEILERNR